MFSFDVTEHDGSPLIRITGRVDSMTSPEIETAIKDLAMAGRRTILCDCSAVTHVSSAGLRVFLSAQQSLSRAGGEMILIAVPDTILRVFAMSGFTRLFRMFPTVEEVQAPEAAVVPEAPRVEERRIDDLLLRVRSVPDAVRGRLTVLGDEAPLASCAYEERDVVRVPPGAHRFGLGIATAGERFEEYSGYFGEAAIIEHSLWYLPAVARPVVDDMIFTPGQTEPGYQFLTGAAFDGSVAHTVSITCDGSHVTLERVGGMLADITTSRRTGVVFLAESRGLMGMHLKRIPLASNRPAASCDIFSEELFHRWFNYPIEPDDHHHVVIGVGVLERDTHGGAPRWHTHGCVSDMGLVNNDVESFEAELARTTRQMHAIKVQHLLASTRLGRSVYGLIELED